jgi:hypothetical protein
VRCQEASWARTDRFGAESAAGGLRQTRVRPDICPDRAGTARLLLKDYARVSCALGGAQDNTELEAFNSCFKTENRALPLDARSPTERTHLVAERMAYCNNVRRHLSNRCRAPTELMATPQPWT